LLIAAVGLWMALRKKWLFLGLPILVLGLVLSFLGAQRVWEYQKGLLRSDYTAGQDQFEQLEKADLSARDKQTGIDWPQWRGPDRDGVARDTGLLAEWPKDGPTVVWRQPIGGGFSSPAIAAGRIYCMDKQGNEERLLCLEAYRGKLLWEHRYPVDYRGM